MANFVELIIDQGTDFNASINLTDDRTNAYVNAVGYTVTSKLRKSYYSANASGQFICTVSDGANGEITLAMSAANTANLGIGRYIFDVKCVDLDNRTSRALEGMITVTGQVTR